MASPLGSDESKSPLRSLVGVARWLLPVAILASVLAGALADQSPRLTNPAGKPAVSEVQPLKRTHISVCSFNIQWLGQSRLRENAALAQMLEPYDIIVVQELVAPPYEGTFPSGNPYRPNPRAAEFFDAMTELGFVWWLSEEDTGRGERNELNSAATEWWVTFYREEAVKRALDLPNGFLGEPRVAHPDWERVPYAFSFRTVCLALDFVLISVHLKPGRLVADRERRANELEAIHGWITERQDRPDLPEFIILGDMNIMNRAELDAATPPSFVSLNLKSLPTNTNPRGPRPYDHVMYSTTHPSAVDTDYGFVVIDLVQAMEPTWTGPDPYPGNPYGHNRFRQHYSDHHPVSFRLAVPQPAD